MTSCSTSRAGFCFTDLGKGYGRLHDRGAVYYATPDGKDGQGGRVPDRHAERLRSFARREDALCRADDGRTLDEVRDHGAGGEIKPAETLYRNEKGVRLAGGGYQMFDSLASRRPATFASRLAFQGAISAIAPDGTVLEQVETGIRVITNICFGGPDLKTAFICLSSTSKSVATDWPRPGLPLNFLNK